MTFRATGSRARAINWIEKISNFLLAKFFSAKIQEKLLGVGVIRYENTTRKHNFTYRNQPEIQLENQSEIHQESSQTQSEIHRKINQRLNQKFSFKNQPLPLISIIIPVYNAAKFLDQTITSCLKQDYPHLEIILNNDGSIRWLKIICEK